MIEHYAIYSPQLNKLKQEIQIFRKEESLRLPDDLDYSKLPFLSNEERQKLTSVKPATLGAAGRISGITPSSLISLLQYLKRFKNVSNDVDQITT